MSTREDFQGFYDRELLPVLQKLEIQRAAMVKHLGLALGAALVLGLGIGGTVFAMAGPEPGLVVGGLLAFGGGALAWWLLTKDYRQTFKDQVIRRVIGYVDSSLTYQPKGFISEGDFRHSTLFKQRIDRYRGEDYVAGAIDKTAIRFSELHAEYKTTTTDSKGRRRTQWHTIFKGLFFVADFNKHFEGRTVVLPDRAQKFLGRFAQSLQSLNITRDSLIKLEDPEFEREFVVYGTDQVEARYILSTSLMRRLLDFRHKVNVPIYAAFVSSHVYLAFGINRNLFEPRIFRTLLDPEPMHAYLEDVLLAVGIVEDLNLNTRIWTKQ